jgi:Spy/CpxP family protein refolding chaperone
MIESSLHSIRVSDTKPGGELMKKTQVQRLALTVLLGATTVLAQGRGGHGPGGPRGNHLDFLATVLNLTDAQKSQATEIFEAAQTASTALRETHASQRAALGDAAKSNAADTVIDQLAASLGATSGQLAAIQAKAFAKFYALLTAEQRTKLDDLHASRGGPGGPGAELLVGPGF